MVTLRLNGFLRKLNMLFFTDIYSQQKLLLFEIITFFTRHVSDLLLHLIKVLCTYNKYIVVKFFIQKY